MSIDDIWAAGRSTTKRAWLTNPARNSLFIVARPYLAEIDRSVAELAAAVATLNESIRSDDENGGSRPKLAELSSAIARVEELSRNHSEDAAASLRMSSALKEELQRFTGLIDGLRKDQLAWGHRLRSLEDGVEEARVQAEYLRGELTRQLLELERSGKERQSHDEVRLDAAERRSAETDQRFALMERQLETFGRQIEEIRAPAGMTTLIPNHPVAVSGTSIVLSSGPYGCFMLRQPDLISDHILAGSFWDPHLKPVIERAGRSGGSAIDAGAYLGFHTIHMSRFFDAVWAFEPQTEIYRMLCANLLLNNCHNVTAINAALYDSPGQLRLGDSTKQEIPLPRADGAVDYNHVGNAAALTFQATDQGDRTAISAQTIDGLDLDDLAFLKVDTQGSDLHVLKGARGTIQRCRPVITAEYERELARAHGDNLEDYHRFFDEIGYDIEVLDSRGEGKQIDMLATPR